MIYLADVNLLLFLADPASSFHPAAKSFFKQAWAGGWATCPITENGFVRILGNPRFPGGPSSTQTARAILRQWQSTPGHKFWPDDLSFCDSKHFPDLPSAKHLTDCYLLGLAVKHGGKLVTFDQGIDPAWIPGGKKALLVLDAANP
ncbi:MAG: TA system VapC family ribonuclease toxin [Luteolibacter sp.]